MFDVGAIVGRLELGLEGWKKSVEAVKADQQSMTGFAMRHGQEIENLGKKFALAGAAITAALSAIVISTGHAGDQFDEMSAKTGISTETLSTLKLAADKSGTSIDSVAAGMKFLAAQMLETSSATDKSKTILGALGIQATDTNGKLRPMNEVLFDVAERFKGMEDGAIKVKLAVVLFGRAGMDMIPILNLGRKGLEENEAAAKRLGIEWSGPSAKAAAAFDDSMVDLKASGTGLNKVIGEALMPTVKSLTEKITDIIVGIIAWAKEHPALIEGISKLALGAGILLTTLGTVAIGLVQVIKTIGALKALAIAPIIFVITIAIPILAKAVSDFRDEFKKMGNVMDEAAARQGKTVSGFTKFWEGLTSALTKVTTGTDWAALAHKKLSEAVDKVSGKIGICATAGASLADSLDKQGKESSEFEKLLQTLLDALGKTKDKTKSLKEEMGLTFTSDLRKRLEDIATALKKYKDELPESEVRRLKAEQRELNDQLATGGLVLGMVEQRLKALENPIGVITAHMEGLGKAGTKAFAEMGAESWVTVKEVESGWNDLYNNLTQGWASTLQSWFEGTLTFSDFLKETWGDIKEAFFTVIAQMVAEWTIKFIKRLITDAAGLFKDIGEFFSKLFKGVSEGAEEAGKSIAKNIGENLKDIGGGAASMAGSFLQAASSIAGIVTAISTILLLLKGTDKQTDVTYWLKRIDDKTQEIHDCLLVDYKGYFNDFWNFFYAIERHTNDVIDAVYSVKNAINDLESFQHGGYVPETGLAMLHAGEWVIPPAANQGFVNAALPTTGGGPGSIVNFYNTFEIQGIDGPSIERLVKGPIRDIFENMFRQNKGGLTTNVNKWLKATA